MNHSPLISIVMPSLNQSEFISDAVDSVLSQDYQNLELIVADGGSTDDTKLLLESKTREDGRIRWFSETDSGRAQALNRALGLVRGTIVGWLNSDDLYTPGAVSRAVQQLEADPSWLMVYGHGEHIDRFGKLLDRYPTLPPETPFASFRWGCFVCQPTVFFRRTLLVLLGRLDESLKCAFDFDYWLRAFSAFPGRICFVEAVQALSRLHDDCITIKQRRAIIIEGMQVLARHFGTAPKEWVLTFAEELLAGKIPHEAGTSRREIMQSLLTEVSSLLSAADIASLGKTLTEDSRLNALARDGSG
jgi:glycosyltransferase involved in cell wall biosynthesis